ncbi:MAG: aldo/keto reductase, partial [Mycobacteriaceae bacterium]
IGSSNMAPWQVVEAEWVARTNGLVRFISAQNEYSFLERGAEQELVPALQQYGVGLLPYFPLASGMLTGKYRRGHDAPADSRIAAWGRQDSLTDARFDVVEALESFAHERGVTLLDVAIGGLAAQATVGSVIAGATSAEQVLANVAAAAWTPTAQDRTELDRVAPTSRIEGAAS